MDFRSLKLRALIHSIFRGIAGVYLIELTCFRITNPYEFFLGKLRNMTFTIFTLVTKEYKNIGLEITEQTLHLSLNTQSCTSFVHSSFTVPNNSYRF